MDGVATEQSPSCRNKRPFVDDAVQESIAEQSMSVRLHQDQIPGPIGPTSPSSMDSSTPYQSTSLPNGTSRQPSPALSTASSLTSISTTPTRFGLDGAAQSTLESQPTKKRKLTYTEKQQRQAEKVEKDRIKAEQRAKKEEEKQVKDEERRQKNELKEELKREKELEKQRREQEREEEKRRREEEIAKKERAQARIHSFFARPQGGTQTPNPSNAIRASASPHPSPGPARLASSQNSVSDFERTFLPFTIPSNTICAPITHFSYDDQALAHLLKTFDELFQPRHGRPLEPTIQDSMNSSPWELAPRGFTLTVRDAMSLLDSSAANPVDLTCSSPVDSMDVLMKIPVKYIYHPDDVRPPYVGTYTKGTSRRDAARVARNPHRRVRSDTDYDYDSEAEWEEPEDGEDLESEGESDTESVDTTEDLGGFLDDEDAADGHSNGRKVLVIDMEPGCSGLCWEDEDGHLQPDRSHPDRRPFLKSCKLSIIEASAQFPIDPYSTSYWVNDNKATYSANVLSKSGAMDPPTLPLQLRANSTMNGIFGSLNPDTSTTKKSTGTKATTRMLIGEDLEDFKRAVSGSVYNKQGLIAILKTERFPKIPIAVLNNTLSSVAVRHGKTEAEKRWVILEPA